MCSAATDQLDAAARAAVTTEQNLVNVTESVVPHHQEYQLAAVAAWKSKLELDSCRLLYDGRRV